MNGMRDAAPRSARSAGSSRAPYPKLHPGPGWPREQAASHQRARIHAAMIEIVAERGYDAVTVRETVRLARVAPRTFYEHYADKEECFLYVYELLVWRSIKRVGAAQRGCHDWRGRLQLAFGAFAREIARQPKAARLALIEAFAGGPAALERMRRAEGMFEAMIEQSFACAPDAVPVEPLVVKGIVAGVARVARARLQAGRAHELPGLADELLEWALCLHCQAATALGGLDDPAAAPTCPGMAPAIAGDAGGALADDRTRILHAAARLAAEGGYGQLTIPQIRAAAGVSRKRFDDHFEDAQGCFIAALEHHSNRALAYAATAGTTARSWPGGMHRVLHALCAYVAADPVFARLAFIEVFAAGPGGVRRRGRIIESIAKSLRASAPARLRPSETSADASVGAIWGILHWHVATGRAHLLPQITATLSYLALAPAIGAQHAVEAITAERARMRTP